MNELLINENEFWNKYLFIGRTKILENVKVLIYKENPQIFELLDFENDVIFNEPFLFAYFYEKNKSITLMQLLWGYISKEKRPQSIKALVDKFGYIYLPNIGWFKTNLSDQEVVIKYTDQADNISISIDGNEINFHFEPILLTENQHFEIVRHQHPLLSKHFFDSNNNIIRVEIDNVTITQKYSLSKAFLLIQNFEPEFYKLLKLAIFKVVIFKDILVQRNSFATLSVHGCAFFNAFQEEYDEIFFVEDIGHQCGHVIFNNLTYGREDLFKISKETVIKEKGFFGMIVNLLESRTLYVAFHAIFTYYGITRCLLACLSNAELTTLQKHEAMGRLAFCFRKYRNDIKLLSKVARDGRSFYFTEHGNELFEPMVSLYNKVQIEFGKQLLKINLFNQPYNFSVKKFHKSNPLS